VWVGGSLGVGPRGCALQAQRRIILVPTFSSTLARDGATMDLGDLTQLVLVATTALVLARVGLAFARLIERRSSGASALNADSEDRLRVLEEECTLLRQELSELQDRQDFTERALLHDPAQPKVPDSAPSEGRVPTPR
jgi:hypothetical protein